jgi:hypothetical protein
MKANEEIPEFSVFGGALNKLGTRLGLVGERSDSKKFGIAIGSFFWIVLLVLSLLEGNKTQFFSLNIVAGHIRLLFSIPLFFICETWVAPRMADFVRYMLQSGIVIENDIPHFLAITKGINKLKDSWIVDGVLLLLVFAIPLLVNSESGVGTTSSLSYIMKGSGSHLSYGNGFYFWFCLPLYRFLLARWFWQLGLWSYFLYQTQKLKLNLIPTHSDGVGGLGYLEVVHTYFSPLSLALSAIISAAYAEEIISGKQQFESMYSLIPISVFMNLLIFVAPLFIFFKKLKTCKINGLKSYMIMSSRYVEDFDHKWINSEATKRQSQLGTPDLQSLADLSNSIKIIQGMRIVPLSKQLLTTFLVTGILPFLPFLLLKFNLNELFMLVLKLVTGH